MPDPSEIHAKLAAMITGYTARSSDDSAIETVNFSKELENRLGDWVEVLREDQTFDKRFIDIAVTHFQLGFMALNRAVFQPESRLK